MRASRMIDGSNCPECGQGQLLSLDRAEDFEFDLGDQKVEVHAENVPIAQCNVCGMITSGPDAAKVRHEAICTALGLLTPAEIRAMRESFCWSQQYLADLTDFGIATVSRWERGRLLQNRSANKVLQAIRDCPAFREYLIGLLAVKSKTSERGRRAQADGGVNVATDSTSPGANRIRQHFPHLQDVEKAERRARVFQLAPGVN